MYCFYTYQNTFSFRYTFIPTDTTVNVCMYIHINRRGQTFYAANILKSDYCCSANIVLELLQGVSVPNYLDTNILTSLSSVIHISMSSSVSVVIRLSEMINIILCLFVSVVLVILVSSLLGKSQQRISSHICSSKQTLEIQH